MKGQYLSEIVNMNDFQREKLNLIYAPCGSGKTTFAKTKLLKFFLYESDYEEFGDDVDKESDLYWNMSYESVVHFTKDKILYLIDTAMGKEQLLHSKGARSVINPWTGQEEWELPGFRVMTYAGFGFLCKHYPEHNRWKSCSLIVCDELHNAIKWSKYNNKKKDEKETVEQENYHAYALQEIVLGIFLNYNLIIALSATPDSIYKEFGNTVHKIELLGEPRHYENKDETEYNDLTTLLKKIPSDKRGIIYVTHITDIIGYQEQLSERGINSVALWSIKNEDYPLSLEQLKVRDYIINNREVPPDVNVLFINKSCETSINIGNEVDTKYPIDYMIIHSKDNDTVVQARGRYRNDLELLYYREVEEYDFISIPNSWLEKKLSTSDKEILCKQLGLKNNANGRLLKWTSIKKILKACDYPVYDIRENGERYSIIYPCSA